MNFIDTQRLLRSVLPAETDPCMASETSLLEPDIYGVDGNPAWNSCQWECCEFENVSGPFVYLANGSTEAGIPGNAFLHLDNWKLHTFWFGTKYGPWLTWQYGSLHSQDEAMLIKPTLAETDVCGAVPVFKCTVMVITCLSPHYMLQHLRLVISQWYTTRQNPCLGNVVLELLQ